MRARSTDLLPVDVFFPSEPTGAPASASLPALVLLQGGLVETEQYAWLAEALARRGFVVALPHHETRLAILSIDDGRYARELLAAPPEGSLLQGLVDADRVGVAGHSLGGVVAIKLALQGGFSAVALLASLPDSADEAALRSFTRPSLSLAGAADCEATLAEVRAGWEMLPPPTALAIVEGATHYQFTASDAADVRKGCAPVVALADSHRRIASTLAAFLESSLNGGGVGEAGLRAVDGVEVVVR